MTILAFLAGAGAMLVMLAALSIYEEDDMEITNYEAERMVRSYDGLEDKHHCECRQISEYDEALKEARKLLRACVKRIPQDTKGLELIEQVEAWIDEGRYGNG